MAKPSTINSLCYIVQRQYNDKVIIKNKLFSERLNSARNLYRKDLLAHYGCVNAIEFSENGEFLISGGDDKRVLLWTLAEAIYDRGSPVIMKNTHGSNIFCLTFDSKNKSIFSGGNDDQVLIHDVDTRSMKAAIPHEKPVYGISIHPHNDNVFATAGEDGRILMFDVRENLTQDYQVMAQQNSGFHSVMFNPLNPRFMVTANSEDGVGLWDCRKPKVKLIHYDSKFKKISGISACFDSAGKKILALRRRLPPVLYSTECEQAACQFYHPQYYNSCTMKTCCFAGVDNEYVLSGSDDFNLYMWKVPTDDSEWGTSHVVLRGHRSIVNQVIYNNQNNFIASSGVEKMVKLWSALPVGNWTGSILKEHSESARVIYSHEDYVSLVGTADRISHDYSDQSTYEDAKMIAFFDSLIQKEIEGWDSESNVSANGETDSDDEMDWAKIISQIYKNGRHTAEPRRYRSNRITQLISKKKNLLAKLAHNKSYSFYQKSCEEKKRKRKLSKIWPPYSKKYKKRSNKKSILHKEPLHKFRPRKYITLSRRRSLSDQYINPQDIPTTSTGFTGLDTSIFRVVDEDSDDEPNGTNHTPQDKKVNSKNSCVKLQRTSMNGSRSSLNNSNMSEHISHTRTRSNEGAQNGEDSEDNVVEDEQQSTSTEPPYPVVCTAAQEENDEGVSVDSDSDNHIDFTCTPMKHSPSISDSGCTTGPSSSASSCSTRHVNGHLRYQQPVCSSVLNGNDDGSSDDEYQYSKFRKRVKKARMNIRKKYGADSDSN